MKFAFTASANDIRKEFAAMQRAIAGAENAAIREATAEILQRGRASLASAFPGSTRWPASLKANLYPAAGGKLTSAAFIYDTIRYAEIFEEGGTITGEPLLWLPFDDVPKGLGGHPLSPLEYAAKYGPLILISRPGHHPLLAARAPAGKRAVPLFVGIDRVTIRKRLDLRAIIADVNRTLAARFEQHLQKVT